MRVIQANRVLWMTVCLLFQWEALCFADDVHHPWFAAGAAPPAVQTSSVTPPGIVRVRIAHTKSALYLGCTGAYDFMALSGGKVHSVKERLTLRRSSRGIQVGRTVFNSDILAAPVSPTDFLTLNGRRYRGALILEPVPHGRMDVIEQLDLEEYLYGVLPREVGADWPLDALKAQAVVSRTYVLANLATDPDQRFDVSSGVSDQVYGGREDEAPPASQAVDQTRGEVLVDKLGKPFLAFFHSSCGGQTETPEYVWTGRVPEEDYAASTDAYCKDDPYYHWELTLSAGTIRARLRRAGIRVGSISQIKIAKSRRPGAPGCS